MNGVWNEIEKLCHVEDYISYTYSTQKLNDLSPDSYYRVELRAHNSIGYSLPTNVYLKTARGESHESFGTFTYQAGFGTSGGSNFPIASYVLCSFAFVHLIPLLFK